MKIEAFSYSLVYTIASALRESRRGTTAESPYTDIVCPFRIPCQRKGADYDDGDDPEMIHDPWKTIISKRKTYHDIRIHGDKKHVRDYRNLTPQLVQNWPTVVKKCSSAAQFDASIHKLFSQIQGMEESL